MAQPARPPAGDLPTALARARTLLEQRPGLGLHDDATATARWQGGTRVRSSHASGASMETDMPAELGGSGDRVSPGWLFRAGLASCAATTIAMTAAQRGIALDRLEVAAASRSDTRGLLGMAGADGQPIPAGPSDLTLTVRIAASGVPDEALRALVRDCQCLAPIGVAVRDAQPLRLEIEIGDARLEAR